MKNSLQRIVKRFGMPEADTLVGIFASWPDAVGEDLAEHSRPLALRNGVLRVVVDDSQWLTQLKWVSTQVVERLNSATNSTAVERLELRLE